MKGRAPLFDPREYWSAANEEDRAGINPEAKDIQEIETELESYLKSYRLVANDSEKDPVETSQSINTAANPEQVRAGPAEQVSERANSERQKQ